MPGAVLGMACSGQEPMQRIVEGEAENGFSIQTSTESSISAPRLSRGLVCSCVSCSATTPAQLHAVAINFATPQLPKYWPTAPAEVEHQPLVPPPQVAL